MDGPVRYAYARGNPVRYSDPSGKFVAQALGALASGILEETIQRYFEAGRLEEDEEFEGFESYAWTQLVPLYVFASTVSARGGAANCAEKARKPWLITEKATDKIVSHPRFGKFYRHQSTGLWWTKDQAGHGGVVWKVYKKKGNRLVHRADADEFGDFILSKHKGPIGEEIPWSEVIGG